MVATEKDTKEPIGKSGAYLVAAGIFLSRIAGFVRERALAYYFGNSDYADAFKAALRIPNYLQNLFGEGVLSASFIPVYSKLVSHGDDENASNVAGTVASLLFLVVSGLALIGVLGTPYFIDLIAPGFVGAKRELTITLVRITFPAAAVLVMSAWCLGVLNSHRKFFLSYSAPIIWNFSMVAALVFFGGRHSLAQLVVDVTWGQFFGSVLQLLVQLPATLRLLKRLRLSLSTKSAEIRIVIRTFIPVLVSRGVVQLSSWVDSIISSYLGSGAVSAFGYASTIYTLPVSLFGMSIAAAELPAMSGATGSIEERREFLLRRLNGGLKQISFFVVPSMLAFLFLGDVIIGALYQTGAFHRADTLFTWSVLAGSAVGLVATTQGRLYSSGFYSLNDTRTPVAFAIIRIMLTTGSGYLLSIVAPRYFPVLQPWSTAGLTLSAGLSGWVEFILLQNAFRKRVGHSGVPFSYLGRLWAAGLVATLVAWGAKLLIGTAQIQLVPPSLMRMLEAAVVLIPYGVAYVLFCRIFGIQEANTFVNRIFRRKPRR